MTIDYSKKGMYPLDIHKSKEGNLEDLKTIRISQGLSRAELAVKAQVGITTIIRAERGVPVGRITLAKICKALGIKLEDVEGLNILN